VLIPYEFNKCIVCLEREPGDREHIIPQMIGGRLSARLLCNSCNHNFGSEIVSGLKTDPSIRLAIEALKNSIPILADRFLSGAEYVARGEEGTKVRLTRSGDSLKVLPGKGADDSIILDTNEALGALAKKLRRQAFPEETIREFQKRFISATEDEPVDLPIGEVFVKRALSKPTPKLGYPPVEGRMWLLLAFEFTALVIGNKVFRSSFDPIRALVLGQDNDVQIHVGYFSGGSEYGPFHILRLIPNQNILGVEIRLFRRLVFQVQFDWIGYEGLYPVYLEDLEDKRSFFAPDIKYAEENRWLEF